MDKIASEEWVFSYKKNYSRLPLCNKNTLLFNGILTYNGQNKTIYVLKSKGKLRKNND